MASAQFAEYLVRLTASQICRDTGFHAAESSALDAFSDVIIRYVEQLGRLALDHCNYHGRTEPNLDDFGQAMVEMGLEGTSIHELLEVQYKQTSVFEIPAFPKEIDPIKVEPDPVENVIQPVVATEQKDSDEVVASVCSPEGQASEVPNSQQESTTPVDVAADFDINPSNTPSLPRPNLKSSTSLFDVTALLPEEDNRPLNKPSGNRRKPIPPTTLVLTLGSNFKNRNLWRDSGESARVPKKPRIEDDVPAPTPAPVKPLSFKISTQKDRPQSPLVKNSPAVGSMRVSSAGKKSDSPKPVIVGPASAKTTSSASKPRQLDIPAPDLVPPPISDTKPKGFPRIRVGSPLVPEAKEDLLQPKTQKPKVQKPKVQPKSKSPVKSEPLKKPISMKLKIVMPLAPSSDAKIDSDVDQRKPKKDKKEKKHKKDKKKKIDKERHMKPPSSSSASPKSAGASLKLKMSSTRDQSPIGSTVQAASDSSSDDEKIDLSQVKKLKTAPSTKIRKTQPSNKALSPLAVSSKSEQTVPGDLLKKAQQTILMKQEAAAKERAARLADKEVAKKQKDTELMAKAVDKTEKIKKSSKTVMPKSVDGKIGSKPDTNATSHVNVKQLAKAKVEAKSQSKVDEHKESKKSSKAVKKAPTAPEKAPTAPEKARVTEEVPTGVAKLANESSAILQQPKKIADPDMVFYGYPEPPKYNPNEDFYCICGRSDSYSTMIGCDTCEEWYHQVCLGYKASMATDWNCFKCVAKKNPQTALEKVDSEWSMEETKKALKIVKNLLAGPEYGLLFANPPDEQIAPGYTTVVFMPMGLTVIDKRLKGKYYPKKNRTPTFRAFHRDIMAIAENCRVYNFGTADTPEWHPEKLRLDYVAAYKKLLEIHFPQYLPIFDKLNEDMGYSAACRPTPALPIKLINAAV